MVSPEEQFKEAVEALDVAAIRQLIDAGGVDLDAPLLGTGETALHLLVKYAEMVPFTISDSDIKRTEAILLLLFNGAEVDVEDNYGKTPFCDAALEGDIALARLFLIHGADIDSIDCENKTPLNRAVQNGSEAMAEWLLEQGADASIDDVHFSTPADNALNLGHYSLHQQLLEYEMPPRVYVDSLLPKEELLEQNEAGLCPLDSNLTWYRFPQVREAIAEAGTRLEKQELLTVGRGGKTYLQRGIECAQGGEIFAAMKEAGEYFTPEELLDGQGKPNQLLDTIIKEGLVADLFCLEFWQEQPAAAMRQLHQSLPEEAQAEVQNLHALSAEISRQKSHLQREMER